MNEITATSALHAVLVRFAAQVNANTRIRSLIKGWTPPFVVEGRDTGEAMAVLLDGTQIAGIEVLDCEPDSHALVLRGDAHTLIEVFEGRLSPLVAYSDGLLEVYGEQRDQIKLDAIALVLWGF